MALILVSALPVSAAAGLGSLSGSLYLQGRTAGHFANVNVSIEGTGGVYWTVSDAMGNFAIQDIEPGSYTATFTHPLFMKAVRTSVTITPDSLVSLPEVGLWAGDLDQDANVDDMDWYLCSASSSLVSDPAFDMDADGDVDLDDCTLAANNIDQQGMTDTNPPKSALAPLALPAASMVVGDLSLAPQGNFYLLKVDRIIGSLYAAGLRVNLPPGAIVNGVDLQDDFTGGVVRWHQAGSTLYIVIGTANGTAITWSTGLALIHLAGNSGLAPSIVAQNTVGQPNYLAFLPLAMRN